MLEQYSLLSNETLIISLPTIGIAVLFVAAGFAAKYILFKLISKVPDDDKRKLLTRFTSLGITCTVLFGISAVIFKSFLELHLFRTEFLFFDAPHVYYIVLVVLFSYFSTQLLETLLSTRNEETPSQQLDVKRKGILLIKFLIWLIGFSIILRIILVDPSKLGTYELISIKDVSISVFDLLFFSIIFSVTGLVLLGLKKYFQFQAESKKIDRGNAAALFKIIKYVLWVIAIITGLQSAGFNISILLAGSAALLVGFGIGVQNIFADIVSGFILLLERPLKATDVIEVDGLIGRVKSIGIRTTTLYTREDTIIRVPNSKFTSEKIINWSDLKHNTRFKVSVGVAYGSDVELVMECMKRCAVQHAQIDRIPEPFVRFEDFGDSSLDFSVYFWSEENMGIEAIKSDIRICIDKEFRKHKITIPFPQRDVHIIKK